MNNDPVCPLHDWPVLFTDDGEGYFSLLCLGNDKFCDINGILIPGRTEEEARNKFMLLFKKIEK